MKKKKFWYIYGLYVSSVKRFECYANDIKDAIKEAEENSFIEINQARQVVDT